MRLASWLCCGHLRCCSAAGRRVVLGHRLLGQACTHHGWGSDSTHWEVEGVAWGNRCWNRVVDFQPHSSSLEAKRNASFIPQTCYSQRSDLHLACNPFCTPCNLIFLLPQFTHHSKFLSPEIIMFIPIFIWGGVVLLRMRIHPKASCSPTPKDLLCAGGNGG